MLMNNVNAAICLRDALFDDFHRSKNVSLSISSPPKVLHQVSLLFAFLCFVFLVAGMCIRWYSVHPNQLF